jgi:hypothetical protein
MESGVKKQSGANKTGKKPRIAFDSLLKRNGAGLEAPISISGTESAPKLGLDLGKLGQQIMSRHKAQGQPAPPQKP